MPPITITLHPAKKSAAHEFLSRHGSQSPQPEPESQLLKAIRVALQGAPRASQNDIHTFASGNDELAWNDTRVVLSSGGVIKRHWDFSMERQPVEYACIGYLEHVAPTVNLENHDYMFPATSAPRVTEQTPFGPFRTCEKPPGYSEETSIVPTVFIFLRRIGMAFLDNGSRYTFTVPFVVRRAWPMEPYGVMMQRHLDPQELLEASEDDPVLPTTYTLTSPLSEIAPLGITEGVVGSPPRLVDEEDRLATVLPTVDPREMLVWVSPLREPYCLFVTIQPETHVLSIWRYVYIKPQVVPQPLPRERIKERARKRQSIVPLDAPALEQLAEYPPISSLPDMPPALTSTVTMQSLMSREPTVLSFDSAEPRRRRRNSLSDSLDRMRMDDDTSYLPVEHGRMKTAYWAEKLFSVDVNDEDAQLWQHFGVSLFDFRWNGLEDRARLAVSLPLTPTTFLFVIATNIPDDAVTVTPRSSIPARYTVPLIATRPDVKDLLVLKADNSLVLLSTGNEIPLQPVTLRTEATSNAAMHLDNPPNAFIRSLAHRNGIVTIDFLDGNSSYTSCLMIPRDPLTLEVLQIVALSLAEAVFAAVHVTFLSLWSDQSFRTSDGIEFECFTRALFYVCGMEQLDRLTPNEPFNVLLTSPSHKRFATDVAFRMSGLELPRATQPLLSTPGTYDTSSPQLQIIVAPVLYALHTLGENLRLRVDRYRDLRDLAGVICRLAMLVRPEWADYWRRLSPSSSESSTWPSFEPSCPPFSDDRIPVWPPDITAILYGRISNPDWQVPAFSLSELAARYAIRPSYAFGQVDPLVDLKQLSEVYKTLSDPAVSSSIKRAENAVRMLLSEDKRIFNMLDVMPLGLAAPLREAIRSCQLAPPLNWQADMYCAIGREDVAASACQQTDILVKDGFKGTKDFMGPNKRQPVIGQLISQVKTLSAGEVGRMTGVELELDDFTDIRFGQDRRLEDVARMLTSSTVQTYKQLNTDRPEQPNEVDQNKEYQHQALRIAEKTIALAYGRAMFTYGSVARVHRESYTIPQIVYNIRIHPHNVLVNLEMKMISPESILWGEFHNGVAAGLRISPSAEGVESSWISFNKPGDLSAGHAGFLFGLGLSGHLKQMVAWNSFQYLTPKHDLTSIGVLLGLAAANAGTGNIKVTKLLAVHTPALLPSPTVDLNISLMTQSAGLIGMGLLFMGTKHRRYADVCLKEISRKDLVHANLHNEYRETYTTSAALGFGMIMLGKGTAIPADWEMVERLNVLIHGESPNANDLANKPPTFDLTLTSPAATIALGLMYLRTERKDIADMLTLPDTVLSLNRIQPSFLMIRVIARSLIMWNGIAPSIEWLQRQIPHTIRASIEARVKNGASVDDALELAYYNIIAGCCFAVGLKYAGTARQEAYKLIIRYYDLFTRLVYSNGINFDHRIKRSAVRDGLNLLSIALSMVMAGTGEITSFRRLRYAYGMFNQTMYHPSHKYGIHVSTYQAIGLLFLGGGRFTLGTSDAAIASMVIAFFPRYHQMSSDNKVYLQALRHLWVMAVEPRCLVARDVQTKEVVYLPLKLSVRDGKENGMVQLISPTLIPEINKITSIRVDTPRYWPFHLDLENIIQHKNSLIRSQTLYVKRRTAFLSYTEDPRGSRSLFVRSRSSAGEAATLDYPQLTDTKTHPASDLSEFITSFSNDPTYLAFADHFGARDDDTDAERVFFNYCHAALYDSILQGKQQSLQSHFTLFMYRSMTMLDPYFHLRLQDLRFAVDFYSKIFDRRFSGRSENNPRTPLIRDSTVMAALLSLDRRLDEVRTDANFLTKLGSYTAGQMVVLTEGDADKLAWYLLRNGVPVSTLLGILKTLANDAYNQCYPGTPPAGTMDATSLDQGIKEVLHATGTKMTTTLGHGWSVRSLDEIVTLWKSQQVGA